MTRGVAKVPEPAPHCVACLRVGVPLHETHTDIGPLLICIDSVSCRCHWPPDDDVQPVLRSGLIEP